MSFVYFSLFNDMGSATQLTVSDDATPNQKRVIKSPDHPDFDSFPLGVDDTSAALAATALEGGGSQANVEWTASAGHVQPMTTVENGKTYRVSNGDEYN
ncbi:hypothetical protein [Paraburkholderia sp. XV]|uniref:hypothetical protein n=1 Tax=Paraburkholderia sp. XV TaxID=2831520 RepID=UPI001CD7D122|nr:hypothetical protein [Paraburkholderia sp. XV]